jgi:hypothetical protein
MWKFIYMRKKYYYLNWLDPNLLAIVENSIHSACGNRPRGDFAFNITI